MAKRAKGEAGAARGRGVFNNLAPKKKKATERVNAMFLGAGREVIGPGKKVGPNNNAARIAREEAMAAAAAGN